MGQRRKKRRKRLPYYIRTVMLAATVLCLAVGVIAVIVVHARMEKAAANANTINYGSIGNVADSIDSNSDDTSQESQMAASLIEADPDLMVLVNKDREFDLDQQLPLRKICRGRLQAANITYKDLSKMLQDASEQGYSYWIASAYRSRERQQELINDDVAKNIKKGMDRKAALALCLQETMPAGYSEHETGLAFDILASSDTHMDTSQADTPENQWLLEHSYEYGFILRYPKEKADITGISYEPWHFRYVGKDAASFMHEKNLTLEELYACAYPEDDY